jgi:acyl-CoA dehydrogenase
MKLEPFNQPPPSLGNQWQDDAALRSLLARRLPPEVLAEITPSLDRMGALAAQLHPLQLSDRENEPVHTQWGAWGERIDHIEVTEVWKRAEVIAAEEGVVATAYERKHGAHSRIHQFALAYLFGPATDVYSCPLAMTDGAARTLLASGNAQLIERAIPRLTSRRPETFWTSGQWMTESTGGSDVGRSETIAVADPAVAALLPGGSHRLWGRKWFTSATTSQMTLTLARPEGNGPGGKGLALFYVETRDERGRLRDIEVNRLKDKLGTRKVPTAELMLRGAPASLVLGPDNGVRNITPMLNVTRTWNSVISASLMRRGVALARDYASKRVAFGAPLADKPLHLTTLATLAAEHEAALQLVFEVVARLGRLEAGTPGEHDEALLRLLTPLAKLTTGKQAVALASETLESFGGAGYVEDTGLPTLLRDAQVLPIWEGTTNVLSLDTVRALATSPETGPALLAETRRWVSEAEGTDAAGIAVAAAGAIENALRWLMEKGGSAPLEVERDARRFALTLGRSLSLLLLASHAAFELRGGPSGRSRDASLLAARRFAASPFDLLSMPGDGSSADEIRRLALGT